MELQLKDFAAFCQIYIDDIAIASKTFKQHLAHLQLLFTEVQTLNIALEPSKSFLGHAPRSQSKPTSTPNSLHSANNPLSPTKPPRIRPNRARWHLPGVRIMPATIATAHCAIQSGVLVSVDGVKPRAADCGRVEEEVYLLAVVE